MSDEYKRYQELRAQIQLNGSFPYIGYILQRIAAVHPHRVALICQDQQVTYQHLYQSAVACSLLLQAYEVRARDRVMLFMQNSVEFYIAYFGILHIGAVVMPVNTFLFGTALEDIIVDAQPKLIIATAELLNQLPIDGNIPILTHHDLNSMQTQQTAFAITALPEDEMAVLLYTSGTTGKAKGVMLSSKNIMTNIVQGIARLGFLEGERVLAILPLFHSFAQATCVWAALFMASTIIVVPRIDRRLLLQGLNHEPTIFLGVPALYGLLCLLRTAPLQSVKLFVCGGDALSDKIRLYFGLLYRRKICNGYGLTETSPLVAFEYADQLLPTTCVGRPVVGMEVEVRDEDCRSVPPGEKGTLWVKGDNVMRGYYNDTASTNAMIQNGWLDTGDLAYIDAHGRIIITGRAKDLIIHKGFNIYPQEIENIIHLHPTVIRVAVVGKADEESGEVPVAFVQVQENVQNLNQILSVWCANHLAAYKVPRMFIITTQELPMTATGKVDKKALKKRL